MHAPTSSGAEIRGAQGSRGTAGLSRGLEVGRRNTTPIDPQRSLAEDGVSDRGSFSAGMAMLTYVEFRSDLFPADPDEDETVNPGVYGRQLAMFLAGELRGLGFNCGQPFAEDWGWHIPVENEAFKLWIGCGNYAEYPDGFLCFIEPHMPVVRKLFAKIDTVPRVEALQKAMDTILSGQPLIRDKRWWTHAEFNNPRQSGG
jgi:hypothetical protein